MLTRPVIGYRAWRIRDGELIPRHRGVGPWQPGVNKARCQKVIWHEPPHSDCMCGLYAYHELLATIETPAVGYETVTGAVVGWGAMEVYRDGWRSQFARIVALLDQREHQRKQLARVCGRYDVPLVRGGSALEREARKHGEPLHKSLLPSDAVCESARRLLNRIENLKMIGAMIEVIRVTTRGARPGNAVAVCTYSPDHDYHLSWSARDRTVAYARRYDILVHPADYMEMLREADACSPPPTMFGIPVYYDEGGHGYDQGGA